MTSKAAQAAQHRRRAAEHSAQRSLAGREIGPLPPVRNPRRKAAAWRSLMAYAVTYFAHTYTLPFSPDHLVVIKGLETAINGGGLNAFGMPRGSGKSVLCDTAVNWALSTGRVNFAVLIGSDEQAAIGHLETLKMELANNGLLAEDWPEICYPIRCLEGISQRAGGQLYRGRPTHLGWTQKRVTLPFIPGSRAAAATVRVAGLTGSFRGMKFARPDGRTVRPQLAVIDDPQTDESARSPAQCETRLGLLNGAVLGLAGPDRRITAVMPCTVIRPGDLADEILDRDKNPAWQGRRFQMLYKFPDAMETWEKYSRILAEDLAAGKEGARATEFYRAHRAEMDAGSKVAWAERFYPGELSAVQHAMNLFYRNRAAFMAEYQNAPEVDQDGLDALTADDVRTKLNGLKRGQVPADTEVITAHIDVHDRLLYWAVAAFSPGFTGYVIDYGTWPDQRRAYFHLRDAKPSLQEHYRRAGQAGIEKEAAIVAGLGDLTAHILGKEWKRQDGSIQHCDLCLVDIGYKPDAVRLALRASPYAPGLLPARGEGITAARKPFSEYRRETGTKMGHYWRLRSMRKTGQMRHLHVDVNFWKTFAHTGWGTPLGATGCLSLWGKDPLRHRLWADHQVAEYSIETIGRARTVHEWFLRAAKPDNHHWDNLVGCLVGASHKGIQPASQPTTVKKCRGTKPRPKISFNSW